MKLKFIFILVLMILLGSNLLAATQEEVIGSFLQKITGQYHIGKCKVLINIIRKYLMVVSVQLGILLMVNSWISIQAS